MNIITGYRGEPHITSQQDRYVNQGSYGAGSYVLPVGNKFAATIDSSTSVSLSSGALSIQGCVAVIESGQTETVEIMQGAAGQNRYDLICARYTKESNGVESVELVVITGSPSTGTPVVPSISSGSIENGDTPVDFALFRVNVTGITISSVTRVGAVNNSIAELMTLLSSHTGSITTINSTLSSHTSSINSINTTLSQHSSSIASLGTRITDNVNALGVRIDAKAFWFAFSSKSDMWSKVAGIPITSVFTFRGNGSWTQDVIAGNNVASWGIGVKGGDGVLAILCVSSNKLHFWTIHQNGQGDEGYEPLNLHTNV